MSSHLTPGFLYPLQWGHVKLPVPDVGDYVFVFLADAMAINKYYLPLPSIDQAKDDTQTDKMLLRKRR